MIVDISYWYVNNRYRWVGFDTVTGGLVGIGGQPCQSLANPCQDDSIEPGNPTRDVGYTLYTDADWFVYVSAGYPYATVSQVGGGGHPSGYTCLIGLTSVVATRDDGTSNGTVTINATGGVREYALEGLSLYYPVVWQSSNVFSNLPEGNYRAYSRETAHTQCSVQQNIEVEPTLSASVSSTNETAAPANDGTITVSVTRGKGNYRVDWNWDVTFTNLSSGTNPQSTQRSSLNAGTYTLRVTDLTTSLYLDFSVIITEPAIPVAAGDYFFVPKMNSLEFVHEISPDNCDTFQTHDNVRFARQVFPYHSITDYYQKVAKCDDLVIQFGSNWEDHTAELRNYQTDALIASYIITQKETNIGAPSDYSILVKNNGAGQSRVYFNTGIIPVELKAVVGGAFQILNNADGFNGTYVIIEIIDDVASNSQYLVINKNYAIVASSSSATARFYTNIRNYNVYEFPIVGLGSVADGYYYVKIRAFTGAVEATAALSEPILLKTSHPECNLIAYRNFDNAFDMTYTTGLISMIRVESSLFKRVTAGTREVTRNGDGRLIKLMAQKQRKVLFEFFQLPPYLHEKLSVIFDHDEVKINGVEYQTEDNMREPDYKPRYRLANSSVVVEQVNWFETYNTDDIQPIEDSGFIIVNEGYLKR